MKIIYVIYNDWNESQVKILSTFGIKIEKGFSRIDLEEKNLKIELDNYLKKWKIEKSVGTIFDKNDLINSNLFVYQGSWTNGYPQPEDLNDYLKLTYNIENYCYNCGIGAVQKSAFRIKKEPKWGEKKIFDLNWVFDEIFIRNDIYDNVFKRQGLDSIPVKLIKGDNVIENVVQLKIPIIKNNTLLLDNQPYEICETCNVKKFNPQIKGFSPIFSKEINKSLSIFKSNEFFGSGRRAYNKIFINKEMKLLLEKYKIKMTFSPCLPP
jgi:hypothetical protein